MVDTMLVKDVTGYEKVKEMILKTLNLIQEVYLRCLPESAPKLIYQPKMIARKGVCVFMVATTSSANSGAGG